MGLAVFCVTGASKAMDFGLGPAQGVILGAITGIGGGMLRDVLLGETPTVLRHELYAIPALLGAGVVVGAHAAGSLGPAFPILGACLCFVTRMIGLPLRHRRAHRAEPSGPADVAPIEPAPPAALQREASEGCREHDGAIRITDQWGGSRRRDTRQPDAE